ncbi:MAG: Gfo/Idh/MocA family oxidoreductase [Pseudomonadota bacterium]
MNVPYIRAEDVEGRLDWGEVADALAAGHGAARAEIGDLFLKSAENVLLSRAAWWPGQGIAVKSVTVMPENLQAARPTVHGAMVLFDETYGEVRAVIDSALVTKWKTAADSLLGARLLARPDAATLTIVGAGSVAASLISAYRSHWPDLAITIWNRTRPRAEALADSFGVAVADDLEAAVRAADIVACCTMAQQPILRGEWLSQGCHVDLIGAFTPEMREADNVALQRARIFVDSFETTLTHIGELKIPLEEGTIARADVLGDLHDLCASRVGREASSDITLYKNGGGAHLDLLTGKVILQTYHGGS